MINFNSPPMLGNELKYIEDVIKRNKISGDGYYTKLCSQWFEEKFDCRKVLMTTSCSHALEMAAILSEVKNGDEIIMPSYTFVSTANAFVIRGARIKFVDIDPTTMNMNANLIEEAITPKTKAIVPVHYAGVSCEMDRINEIAEKNKLYVIEDAAQGVMSKYKGRYLGTLGTFGCYSFHETKNYSMGEGGAIILNDPEFVERAEIIREKGTNRSKFFRGQVDKYTWVDFGSSYLPSELNVAHLYGQLEEANKINDFRLNVWKDYKERLTALEREGLIELPFIPSDCEHNGHMFYVKAKDLEERDRLIQFLKENDVMAVFHYIPLHSSPYGRHVGEFVGVDKFTTKESERLLRLPLYYGLSKEQVEYICNTIYKFYNTVRD